MKKTFSIMLILAVCAGLLSGCRISVHLPTGLSSFYYDNVEKYVVGGANIADTVERVEIQWLSGSVNVAAHKEDIVRFSEEANRTLTNDNSVYYWLDGTTLRIQFCASGEWDMNGLKKDLTVLLPEELMLKELKINGVSAEIEVDSIQVKELNLNTMSGDLEVTGCTITESADFDATSGAVTLILPDDTGMTLRFDTVSGKLSSELPGETDGMDSVFGEGTCECNIDTTSGDLKIRVNNSVKAGTEGGIYERKE